MTLFGFVDKPNTTFPPLLFEVTKPPLTIMPPAAAHSVSTTPVVTNKTSYEDNSNDQDYVIGRSMQSNLSNQILPFHSRPTGLRYIQLRCMKPVSRTFDKVMTYQYYQLKLTMDMR